MSMAISSILLVHFDFSDSLPMIKHFKILWIALKIQFLLVYEEIV